LRGAGILLALRPSSCGPYADDDLVRFADYRLTMPEDSKQLQFHYLKSASFRVIHVDGVIGAPLPRGGGVHIALYSERTAIPQMTVHPLKPDGRIGDEITNARVGRSGVVRELEVDAVMSLDTARDLFAWLQSAIERVETSNKERSK